MYAQHCQAEFQEGYYECKSASSLHVFSSDGNEDGGAVLGQHQDCPLSSSHHGHALPATSGQCLASLCSHTQTTTLVFESPEKRNEKKCLQKRSKKPGKHYTEHGTALLFPLPSVSSADPHPARCHEGHCLARAASTSASPLMQHRDCTDWLMCSLDVAIGFQSHYLNFQQHPHSFRKAFRRSEELKPLISNALDGNQEQRERHNRSSSVSSSAIMESLHTVYALLHF